MILSTLYITFYILFISNTLIRKPILYPDAYVYLRRSSGWWQHQEGQSRVERGNIFPTFTRRQAGPGLVTRQRGKLCVGSAKDVCHITWPRDVPPVATPTTINMHRRVETGVQITSHYILHYSPGQMADNRNICQHPGPDLASGWVLPMVTNWARAVPWM